MRKWPWRLERAHPDDDALVARASGVRLDPEHEAHLQTCPRCAGQVAVFERAWQQVRLEARAEADAEFPETRLARQHATVMRRLAQHGRRARVLAFPRHLRPARASRQVARRWVAAAAVVGLVVGMAAGRFIDDGPHVRRLARPAPSTAQMVRPAAGPSAQGSDSPPGDEAFLVELELAAATPRIEPLQALDAMTPRMREAGPPPR